MRKNEYFKCWNLLRNFLDPNTEYRYYLEAASFVPILVLALLFVWCRGQDRQIHNLLNSVGILMKIFQECSKLKLFGMQPRSTTI